MKRILANIAYDVVFVCIVGCWFAIGCTILGLIIVGGIAALAGWGLL